MAQKWCWINTHWCTNILFKNHVSNNEEAFNYEERHNIGKSLEKYLLPAPSEVQWTLDLITKLIASESTFRRTLCGMVVYKVLKSKVEIDLAFFLTLILFSLVTILCNPEFFRSWIKKTFIITFKGWLCAAVIWSYDKSGTNGCFMHFR